MVARSRSFREEFDRSREFVVSKPFTFNGKRFDCGQTVNTMPFAVRLLRQLYDQRYLDHVPLPKVPVGGLSMGGAVPHSPPPPTPSQSSPSEPAAPPKQEVSRPRRRVGKVEQVTAKVERRRLTG